MKGITNKVGPCVEDKDFFGREAELASAWKKLEDGNSLILAAPRRVGKTSFAKKIADIAEQSGWTAIYLDLEGIKTEKEFVEYMIFMLQKCQHIFPRLKEGLKSLISYSKPSVTYKDVEVKFEMNFPKEDLFRKLNSILEDIKDENLLIICDELAIYLDYIITDRQEVSNADFFLNMLRSYRQIRHNSHRWIFCSSISIESFLERHGLSKSINDVERFRLDELNPVEADGLLAALAESYKVEFPEAARSYLLARVGHALPYYIQLMFSELWNIKIMEAAPIISKEDVDQAYEMLVQKQYLNTWAERLNDFPGKDLMRKVLNAIAKDSNGCSRDVLEMLFMGEDNANEVVSNILTALINDGYIVRSRSGQYVFRSFLLRDYWHNKYIA